MFLKCPLSRAKEIMLGAAHPLISRHNLQANPGHSGLLFFSSQIFKQWPVAGGYWPVADGYRFVTGGYRPVSGGYPFVAGGYQL